MLFLVGCSLGGDINTIPTSTSLLVPEVVNEAVRFDTEHYAERYGISTDEALRRFYLMEEVGSLQAQLITQEADTFAGLWIEHEPTFHIVVGFTRDGVRTIRPYLENTHLPGVIELRKAKVTYQDLIIAEKQANELVNQLRLSLMATTSVNIQENRAEIHIGYISLFKSRLMESGLKIPEHVQVITPESQSTSEMPTPEVTPATGIFFPRLTVSSSMTYADLNIGAVFLKGGCLRFGNGTEAGSLLIWSPGYYLNNNQGIIEVLNSRGEPVARAGEVSCYSQAAGDASQAVNQFLSQPLPESCSAPYTLVAWMVLANWEGRPRSFMNAELVSDEETPYYVIQSKTSLQDWLTEPRDVSGKLALGYAPRSRCLYLQDWGGLGGDTLLLWPPGTQGCSDNGIIALCDSDGQVLARLDEQFHLHGNFIQDGEIRMTVNNELPCECMGGGYFVISSVER